MGIVSRAVQRVRNFNRRWIDRLDPDWPAQEPEAEWRDLSTAPTVLPTVELSSGPVSVYAQSTPNPDALKFVAEGASMGATATWTSAQACEGHPVGVALFGVEGVQAVFKSAGFVTVTRRSGVPWESMEDRIVQVLEGLFN